MANNIGSFCNANIYDYITCIMLFSISMLHFLTTNKPQ